MEHFLGLEIVNSSNHTWALSFLLRSPDRTPHCVFPPPLLTELIEHEIHSCGWSLLGDVTGNCKVVFSRPFLSYIPDVPHIVN